MDAGRVCTADLRINLENSTARAHLLRLSSSTTELLGKLRWLSTRLDGGPMYHRGPPWMNRLGFQLFRVMYRNSLKATRSVPLGSELQPLVRALERDGCVKVENFLQPEVFAQIRREYDASFQHLPYENWVVEPNGAVEEFVDLAVHGRHFPITLASVVDNAMLRAVVADVMRQPIGERPRMWSKRWYRPEVPPKPKGLGHVIGADALHADVHFTSLKAWFFLSDVDESNGAFTYVPGSHRMTPARLAYEYEASMRVANHRALRTAQQDVDYARLRAPSDEQSRAMELRDVAVTAKANTLVLANVRGFHRQGQFETGAVREAIMLCFRNHEPGYVRDQAIPRQAPPEVVRLR